MKFRRLTPGRNHWLFGIQWWGTPKAFKATILCGPVGVGVVRNPR